MFAYGSRFRHYLCEKLSDYYNNNAFMESASSVTIEDQVNWSDRRSEEIFHGRSLIIGRGILQEYVILIGSM